MSEAILIIEDNEDLNHALAESLSAAGYRVKSVYTGAEVINEVKAHAYDLILLDLMLPFKSGDRILKQVRTFSDIPVIVISAKDMVETKIDLLRTGADDYITKPFDLDEVAARVASNLRRSGHDHGGKSVTYKMLTLDPEAKCVTTGDTRLDLTAKEYRIMELLLSSPRKVFTKANLYESIWLEDYLGDDQVIKTHISNLRNKLKKACPNEKFIETVWGMGYRLYQK